MHRLSPPKSRAVALAALVAAALLALWTSTRLGEPAADGGAHADLPSELGVARGAGAGDGSPAGSVPADASPEESARSAPAPEPETAAPAEAGEALRLRFVLGTSGRPAQDLAVRVFEAPEDGAPPELGPGARGLAEGRTDAHGWITAPPGLRRRAFVLDVGEEGDGSFVQPNLLLPERLPAGADVLEIAVFRPWARFEAIVVDDAGRAVAGATVQFDFESPALAFSTRDAPSTRVATDGDGLARFALLDPASVGGRLRIKADAAPESSSRTVELPPPLASARVELRLSTSARAVVRVDDSSGAPLAGAMARLERLDPPYASFGRSTDRDGTARFVPLEPGRYTASAEDPATGSSARAEFTVAQCQVSELRLALPPSALPLAVAGRVVDAHGRPVEWLWVSICVDGREEARLAPDAEGRFAYHRAPCQRLRVRLKTAFDGPRVEPEVVDAPFGAVDLAFQLRDAPALGQVALRVVDRDSGEALSGVRALVYRDSAAERIGGVLSALAGSALSLASNEGGWLLVPSGPQLPRAHLVVEKRGYVRRDVELSELERLPRRDGQLVLELVPGFEQRWIVLDARTLAPIAGAVATGGVDPFTGRANPSAEAWGPSAPSDARGILELSLPRAPERVSIQARGYRTQSLETLAAGGALGDAVLLEAERSP